MQEPVSFQVNKQSSESQARAGLLTTARGAVPTPVFMPVGTQAAVKTMSPRALEECGTAIVLSNTYHLYLRPGSDVVRSAGGLHAFMGWPGVVLTDSGGFQVYSLAGLRQVEEEGVTFRSHLDGSKHMLTPERSIAIQADLGADIIMAFDECTPYPAEWKQARRSMELTLRWAKRSYQAHQRSDQALFGIVQGGGYPDLRLECARRLVELDFPGYGIGGLSVGEPADVMYRVLDELVPALPADRPRYLMGVGSPDYLLEAVWRGVDMFDCVFPTRIARHGTVLTFSGRYAVRDEPYARDFRPLEEGCGCYACTSFTRAYIRHLLKAREWLGMHLMTLHNLTFLHRLMAGMQQAIQTDSLGQFRQQFYAGYGLDPPTAVKPWQDLRSRGRT